jgi:hypothetical protein
MNGSSSSCLTSRWMRDVIEIRKSDESVQYLSLHVCLCLMCV